MSRAVGRGQCGVCGYVGDFVKLDKPLRENHHCSRCRASLRYRMQAYAIGMAHGCPDRPLAEVIGAGQLAGTAIYEPGIIGPFRRLFRRTPGYVNSAYWADVAPGDTRDGVRCEDLQQLTFADDSFDLVISSDIFEHVRRPLQGFAEVFRVLRPGGRHVFTVPMRWPLPPVSQPRVDTTTAEDVFVQAARYHSSPTDPRGALVYTDFGMDLPDQLREVGFETATHHGFRNAVTFASRKPGGNGISAAVARPRRWRLAGPSGPPSGDATIA